jgi:hypothetical protein
MNEQLIKFIELCLIDGVVTDKKREVIFRKSKEMRVPKEECEIILEGMIHNFNKTESNSELIRKFDEVILSNNSIVKNLESIHDLLHKNIDNSNKLQKINSNIEIIRDTLHSIDVNTGMLFEINNK